MCLDDQGSNPQFSRNSKSFLMTSSDKTCLAQMAQMAALGFGRGSIPGPSQQGFQRGQSNRGSFTQWFADESTIFPKFEIFSDDVF